MRINTKIVLASLAFSMVFNSVASATEGACSGHSGIDCSVGSDTDGSVICMDGWRGSSVQYTSQKDSCGVDYSEPKSVMTEVFPDVPKSYLYRDAILYLYGKKIISGYPDNTFKPGNEINRAEFLKILVEGAGVSPDAAEYSNCFSDVGTDWFARYVCYAKSIGWVDGYPDSTYKPSQTVNKVEAIKMVLNSQGITPSTSVIANPYDDVSSNAWFAPYVQKAKEMGILEETGTKLEPDENMKRGSVSQLLYKTLIQGLTDSGIATETPTGSTTGEIVSIMLNPYWTNWDADAENDGSKLGAFFKNDNEDQVYPDSKDWTVKVDIYNKVMGDGFKYEKTDLLYSHTFTGNDVRYEQILETPFIRIPKEEIDNPSDKYGWIEATFSSPTYGVFSAFQDFAQIAD